MADVYDGQDELIRFMKAVAPGMGLSVDGGWGDTVPVEHEPLFEVAELVGKLEAPLREAASRASVAPKFSAYVAALTAMKLVAAGHSMGLLDQAVGKAIAAYYLVAGSKTVPPAFEGKRD